MSEPAPAPNTLLSWSTERSKAVATALRAWLPPLVQRCAPWMSAEDIYAGKRWRREMAQVLATVKVGVVCATRDNLDRRWLNYEAGALSVRLPGEEQVIVYCLDLAPDAVGDPLSDFQGVDASEAGTLKLVRAINAAMDQQLKDADLEAVFKLMWPSLKAELDKIPPSTTAPPQRKDREVLDEILARVKGLEDDAPAPLGVFERVYHRPLSEMEKLGEIVEARRHERMVADVLANLPPPAELAKQREQIDKALASMLPPAEMARQRELMNAAIVSDMESRKAPKKE